MRLSSTESPHEIDLTVIYAADTVARRTARRAQASSSVPSRMAASVGSHVLHHDYPLTPGIVGALTDARPSVAVVSGWSTFASQAAIAWCGIKRVPYVLVVESHDEGPRAGGRRRKVEEPWSHRLCRTHRPCSSQGRSRATR